MDLCHAVGKLLGQLRIEPAPLSVLPEAESAYPVDQGGGAATALFVERRCGGSSGEPADVGISGGVYDYLGQDCLAAFLGLEVHALADIAFHDGLAAPGVVHDPDGIGQFVEHDVHLYFKLVRLNVEGVAQHLRLYPCSGAGVVAHQVLVP